jgi:hypothetical protein
VTQVAGEESTQQIGDIEDTKTQVARKEGRLERAQSANAEKFFFTQN